jgi:hypothetical protein
MCWEWGHWAPDCPRTKQKLTALEDPRIKDPNFKLKKSSVLSSHLVQTSHVASITAAPSSSPEALIDSGASHHVTSDSSVFNFIRPIDLKLRVASKDEFCVDGIGDVTLSTPDGFLHLKDVLYCKRIAGTVISLGYFAAWDGSVEFDNAFTLIQNNIRFPTFIRQYRCFLPLSCSPSHANSVIPCSSVPTVSSMQSDLWHYRLGHLGIRTLNKTISKNCVTGLPEKKLKVPRSPCGSCSLAKSQHRPFISDSRGLTRAIGDFVAADLMGPYPDSLEGHKYVMVIQDVHSRLASVVGLSTKAAAPTELLKWIPKFELQTGCKVKTVRTDNAGEFTSKAFEKSLSERSIVHELAVPYEHHQNGQVERTNRTLMEMTRSFLVHAKLPVTLWMHAMKHSAWIFNRLVHAVEWNKGTNTEVHRRNVM